MAKRVSAPSGPHEFVAPEDSRLGLALGSSSIPSGAVTAGVGLEIADATIRSQRCALPGCGKPLGDPIHQPDGE